MTIASTILAAYKTSKFGSKASNCADSYAISSDGLRIAVADGVSKSYMPKFVADALTGLYVEGEFPGGTMFNDDLANHLMSEVIEKWQKKTQDFELSVDEDTRYDLEYQRELYGMGASTFAGICIASDVFTFDILGDSCIFILPEDKATLPLILSSMPCEVDASSEVPFKCDFGTTPHFLDTTGRIVGAPLEDSIKAFDCTILLATDAFSDWFCRNYTHENGKQIITMLREIDSQEKFDSFINDLRAKDLKNDDVAFVLLAVRLMESESHYATPLSDLSAEVDEKPKSVVNSEIVNSVNSEAEDSKVDCLDTKISERLEVGEIKESVTDESIVAISNKEYREADFTNMIDEKENRVIDNVTVRLTKGDNSESIKDQTLATVQKDESECNEQAITQKKEDIASEIKENDADMQSSLILKIKKCLGLN